MSVLDNVNKLSQKRAAIIDSLSTNVPESIGRVLNELESLLSDFLDNPNNLSLGELASLNTTTDLLEIIDAAGLGDLVTAFKEAFTEVAGVLRETLIEGGLSASQMTLDEGALEALVNFRVQSSVELVRADLAREIQTAWVDSTFLGTDIKTATQQAIQFATDRTAAQAETEIGTAISSVDRAITASIDTQDESMVFLYAGPDNDKVLRKSCSYLVGKYLTKAQLAQLDNAQLPNASITLGGYNCRHSLAPMAKSVADAEGIEAATDADIRAFNSAAADARG